MLYRGKYQLPHMFQSLGYDGYATEIEAHAGGTCCAYMLDDDQVKDARWQGYRYICYAPKSAAMSWTAFGTRQDLQDFCDAYKIKLDREPVPGQPFKMLLPPKGTEFLPLTEDLILESPDLLTSYPSIAHPGDKLRKLMAERMAADRPLSETEAQGADEHGNLAYGRAETILRAAGWRWKAEAFVWHPPMSQAAGMRDRLFIGIFPTGISYADRATEEHGDYAKVAFLSYESLELEIRRPRSPLLPLIREDAARMQARRGEDFQVSTAGQTVRLGVQS